MTDRVRLIDAGTGEVLAEGIRPRLHVTDEMIMKFDIERHEGFVEQFPAPPGFVYDPSDPWYGGKSFRWLQNEGRWILEVVDEGARVETDL